MDNIQDFTDEQIQERIVALRHKRIDAIKQATELNKEQTRRAAQKEVARIKDKIVDLPSEQQQEIVSAFKDAGHDIG